MAPCLLQQLLNELQQQQNDCGHQGCCCEDLQELKTIKRKKKKVLILLKFKLIEGFLWILMENGAGSKWEGLNPTISQGDISGLLQGGLVKVCRVQGKKQPCSK